MAIFRIEVIDNNEHLFACNTFNDFKIFESEYNNLKEHYKQAQKDKTIQVFAGNDWENLKEQKHLEVTP